MCADIAVKSPNQSQDVEAASLNRRDGLGIAGKRELLALIQDEKKKDGEGAAKETKLETTAALGRIEKEFEQMGVKGGNGRVNPREILQTLRKLPVKIPIIGDILEEGKKIENEIKKATSVFDKFSKQRKENKQAGPKVDKGDALDQVTEAYARLFDREALLEDDLKAGKDIKEVSEKDKGFAKQANDVADITKRIREGNASQKDIWRLAEINADLRIEDGCSIKDGGEVDGKKVELGKGNLISNSVLQRSISEIQNKDNEAFKSISALMGSKKLHELDPETHAKVVKIVAGYELKKS